MTYGYFYVLLTNIYLKSVHHGDHGLRDSGGHHVLGARRGDAGLQSLYGSTRDSSTKTPPGLPALLRRDRRHGHPFQRYLRFYHDTGPRSNEDRDAHRHKYEMLQLTALN